MNQVVQRSGDPRIFLRADDGEWFYYNPNHECLGSGAMGTVYLGFGVRSGRRIAIKRVNDRYAQVNAIRVRAKQEASMRFRHPNLVQMLGYCECAKNRGPIFILSEYISGVTLDYHAKFHMAFLDSGEKSRRLASEICYCLDALSYLHSCGVIHRDVKPSNIMLENGQTVKLMDLGIARINQYETGQENGFIGTPEYAAPEQIRCSAKVDSRADIYAIGVTLYELVAGFNPFDAASREEVLENQLNMKLPYRKEIPSNLFLIMLKATEKNPDARFQTADEFKAELRKYINGENNSGLFRKLKLFRKHR